LANSIWQLAIVLDSHRHLQIIAINLTIGAAAVRSSFAASHMDETDIYCSGLRYDEHERWVSPDFDESGRVVIG